MVLVLALCRRLGYILPDFRDIFANLHDRNSLFVHMVTASSSASHGAPSEWLFLSVYHKNNYLANFKTSYLLKIGDLHKYK